MKSLPQLLLLCLVLIFSPSCKADGSSEAVLDSLELLLSESSHNQARIPLLIAYSEALEKSDPEKAMLQLQDALEIARNYYNFTYLNTILYNLGELTYSEDDHQQSQQYWLDYLSLQFGNKSEIKRGYALYRVARCYEATGKLEQAYIYFDSAFVQLGLEGDAEYQAYTSSRAGRACYNAGQYGKAMQYYLQANKVFEEHNLRNDDLADLYHYIGSVFKRKGETQKALLYYQKMEKLGGELQDSSILAEAYYLMAPMLTDLGQADLGLQYNLKALELFKKANKVHLYAIVAGNLSTYYSNRGDFVKANQYAKLELEQALEEGDEVRISGAYLGIGDIWLDRAVPDSAIAYYKRGIAMASNLKKKRLLRLSSGFEGLSLAQQQKGDHQQALLSYIRFREINDSLNNLEHSFQINELQARYETERQEKEITDLKNQQKQDQRELEQQETLIWIFSILISLLVLLLLVLVNHFQVRRRLNKKLRIETEKAREAVLAREQFLSNVSHEIRTPLNGIIGITEIINDASNEHSKEEYTKVLNFSAQHLLGLINNMLDYSKLQSGKIEQNKSEFHLPGLLEKIHASLHTSVNTETVDFRLQVDPKVPELVYGDVENFSRILYNLIGNAIKYTTSGYIEICCQLLSKTDKDVHVKMRVSDTGIGISKSYQEQIFERFSRENTMVNKKVGGTGLGLAITKRLLNNFGTELTIESEEGKGSEFSFPMHFGLPTEKTFNANPLVVPSAQGKEALQHLRVLVAEDNEVNLLVLKNYLASYNISPTVVSNGQEAVDQAKAADFDLVLMDIQMPVMDGLEATRQIKLIQPNAYVIALSATMIGEYEMQNKARLMDDFLTKPFRRQQLLEKLTQYLEVKPSY